MQRFSHRGQYGLSMIEVLIASLITGIFFAFIISSFFNVQKFATSIIDEGQLTTEGNRAIALISKDVWEARAFFDDTQITSSSDFPFTVTAAGSPVYYPNSAPNPNIPNTFASTLDSTTGLPRTMAPMGTLTPLPFITLPSEGYGNVLYFMKYMGKKNIQVSATASDKLPVPYYHLVAYYLTSFAPNPQTGSVKPPLSATQRYQATNARIRALARFEGTVDLLDTFLMNPTQAAYVKSITANKLWEPPKVGDPPKLPASGDRAGRTMLIPLSIAPATATTGDPLVIRGDGKSLLIPDPKLNRTTTSTSYLSDKNEGGGLFFTRSVNSITITLVVIPNEATPRKAIMLRSEVMARASLNIN